MWQLRCHKVIGLRRDFGCMMPPHGIILCIAKILPVSSTFSLHGHQFCIIEDAIFLSLRAGIFSSFHSFTARFIEISPGITLVLSLLLQQHAMPLLATQVVLITRCAEEQTPEHIAAPLDTLLMSAGCSGHGQLPLPIDRYYRAA